MTDASDIRSSSVSSSKPPKQVSVNLNGQSILKVILVIVLVVIAFWGGIAYEKHHIKNSSSTSAFTRSGGFGGLRAGGGIGTVSAISSSSITVSSLRTGTTKTYNITSSTKITDDGQSSSVSSIATGDTVIVIPSSSDSSDAASILVNPSFGGYGPAQTNGSNTSSGSATTNSATAQ